MASDVDICNLALSYLGQKGAITSLAPPDGSHYSDVMARHYPNARVTLLSNGHTWSFATKRSGVLADATSDIPAWGYRYAMPSDVLTPISLLSSEAISDEDVNDFLIEGAYLYSNMDAPVLRYIADTTDTLKFPAPFREALARLLASMTAGDIVRGLDARIVQRLADSARYAAAVAMDQDSLKSRNTTAKKKKPAWIAAR